MAPSQEAPEPARVLVGKERRLYNFHKTLLTRRCLFFEKCLSPSFPEGASNEVVLEDEDTEAFDHFFQWIYLQDVKPNRDYPFAALYILADKFCMEDFRNAIVNAAMKSCIDYVFEQCHLLLGHNLSNSPLMHFCIRKVTFDITNDNIWSDALEEGGLRRFGDLLGDTEVLKRFLGDLTEQISYQRLGILRDPSEYGRCFYHEHKATPECKVEEEIDDDDDDDDEDEDED